MTKSVMYGCECDSKCGVHPSQYPADTAPVIQLVERDVKKMKVCSRCTLVEHDKLIKWLITKDMPSGTFFDYDPLIISYTNELERVFAK